MWNIWAIASSSQNRLRGINLLATAFFSLVVPAFGDDQPVIMVSPNALVPQHIEVHVGELIRWRAAGGEHLHLQLDAHPHAHEAVVRSGEIRAVFLVPGVHTYEVLVISDGRRALTGTVTVKEAQGAVDLPRTCGPGSSTEICFEP
jgi:hypothetical protein